MRTPMLISYPRSGRSWLSRAMRAVAGCPLTGVHAGASKRGRHFFRRYGCDSLILLLRDPAYSFIRRATCNYPFRVFTANIKFFEQSRQPKLLIYHEDIFKPECIYSIATWLGRPYKPFGDFEAFRRRIFVRYHTYKRLKYASRTPSRAEIVEAHRACQRKLGKRLYTKYLSRYRG